MRYREMTQDELNSILDNHEMWLRDPDEGKRAELKEMFLGGLNFSNRNLTSINFANSNLSRSNFDYALLNKCDLTQSIIQHSSFIAANLTGSLLMESNLKYTNMTNANLRSANLNDANLMDSNLSGSCLIDSSLYRTLLMDSNLKEVELGSPTNVLLAYWADLSEELTALAMAYDASCHEDPILFNEWAEGGDCPYMCKKYKRGCNFLEKRECWNSNITAPRPFDLMVALIKEKCSNSDWHNNE